MMKSKKANKIFGIVIDILGMPKVLIKEQVKSMEPTPREFKVWCACLVSNLKNKESRYKRSIFSILVRISGDFLYK